MNRCCPTCRHVMPKLLRVAPLPQHNCGDEAQASDSEKLLCNKGHECVLVDDGTDSHARGEDAETGVPWICDKCETEQEVGARRYRCPADGCDFDACADCGSNPADLYMMVIADLSEEERKFYANRHYRYARLSESGLERENHGTASWLPFLTSVNSTGGNEAALSDGFQNADHVLSVVRKHISALVVDATHTPARSAIWVAAARDVAPLASRTTCPTCGPKGSGCGCREERMWWPLGLVGADVVADWLEMEHALEEKRVYHDSRPQAQKQTAVDASLNEARARVLAFWKSNEQWHAQWEARRRLLRRGAIAAAALQVAIAIALLIFLFAAPEELLFAAGELLELDGAS